MQFGKHFRSLRANTVDFWRRGLRSLSLHIAGVQFWQQLVEKNEGES